MAEHTYTRLVPELGEMVMESGEVWLGMGAGAVLHLVGDEIDHVRPAGSDDIIDESGQRIGWSAPSIHVQRGVIVDDGWRIVQIKRDGWPGDMNVFSTPLGDAFLYMILKEET